MWVRQIYKERHQKGLFHRLVKEAMIAGHELFFRMFRMPPFKFEELLNIILNLYSLIVEFLSI